MKRVLPWVLGGLGVFTVGLVCLLLAVRAMLGGLVLDDGPDAKGPAEAMAQRLRPLPGVVKASSSVAYDWLDGDDLKIEVDLVDDPSAEQVAGLAEAISAQTQATPIGRGDRWNIVIRWKTGGAARQFSNSIDLAERKELASGAQLGNLRALPSSLGRVEVDPSRITFVAPGDLASNVERINAAVDANAWAGRTVLVAAAPLAGPVDKSVLDSLSWPTGKMPNWFPDAYRELRRSAPAEGKASIGLKFALEPESTFRGTPERPVVTVLFGDRKVPADQHDALRNDPAWDAAHQTADQAYRLPHTLAVEVQRRAEYRDGPWAISLAKVDNADCRLWRSANLPKQQEWTDYLLRDGRTTKNGQKAEQCR